MLALSRPLGCVVQRLKQSFRWSCANDQVILVLILTVYLMIEKTSPGMFDGQAEIAVEIEASVKSYISLKAVISVVTGVLVRAPGSHFARGTD